MELTDGIVTLRRWRIGDVGELARVANDPEIARWTSLPGPYTEYDAREWIGRAPASAFAITAPGDGRILGGIGVDPVGDGVGEVGYWIARAARGHGVATRALVLVSRWAVAELGLARLSLLAEAENVASLRVAARAGFHREGELRSWREIKGRRCDLVMFSLLPTDI